MITFDRVIVRVPLLARYVLTALLLCGLILAMVVERAAILRDGREVRLEVIPIDPRDLFRGDFVVLDYKISVVEPSKSGKADFQRGQTVFVTLRPDESGKARAVAVSAERPIVSGEDLLIAGKINHTYACRVGDDGRRDCSSQDRWVSVVYGLESYFVPQGEGKAIEATEKNRIEVVAAVSASGKSTIKRLMIDGKSVYAEPPY